MPPILKVSLATGTIVPRISIYPRSSCWPPVRFPPDGAGPVNVLPFPRSLAGVGVFLGLFMTQSAFRKAVLQQRKHWPVKFMVPLAEAFNNTSVCVLWSSVFFVAVWNCLTCVSSRSMSFHGLSLVLNVKLRMPWCGIIFSRTWAQNPPQAKSFSILLLSTSFPSITIERQARGLLSLKFVSTSSNHLKSSNGRPDTTRKYARIVSDHRGPL